MNQLRIHIASALAAIASTVCGQNAGQLLAGAPDSLIPVMSRDNRLDCIDFYTSKMPSKVRNAFGGICRIDTMSACYLRIFPTGSSQVEIRRYPDSGRVAVVAVAYTYRAASRETVLKFHNAEWEPLDTRGLIGIPDRKALSADPDTPLPDNAMVCATIDAANGEITFSLSTDGVPNAPAGKSMRHVWNGRKFEPKGKQ